MQISVRKKALRKLMEVYRDYCNQCSEGHMVISEHLEEISCKILMLCYDRECKEFRFVIHVRWLLLCQNLKFYNVTCADT